MDGKAVTTFYDGEDVICSRCKSVPATICARLDSYCTPCFVRFIRGKQRKLMKGEQFKVKHESKEQQYGVQRVLLAFSGGVSSVVLFDVLASNLDEQIANRGNRGKQGFELLVINIDEQQVKGIDKDVKEVIKGLIQLYPSVRIDYRILSLDTFVIDQSTLAQLSLNSDFAVYARDLDTQSPEKKDFKTLLQTITNKSSVEDLLAIVQSKLLLQTAYLERCQTLVLGHNTTRLAHEIISLTVKGRGGSIHKDISDRSVSFEDSHIEVLYPLRGVLQAEIEAYAKLTGLDVHASHSTETKSRINKNLTVNDLSAQYFKNLDLLGYGNTASTVLRSGEKLGEPKGVAIAVCKMCSGDIRLHPRTWLSNITTNEAAPLTSEEEFSNKDAYFRETGNNSEHIFGEESGSQPMDICYGCTLSLQGAQPALIWPVRRSQKEEILNEYILTDSEDEDL